MNNHAPVKIPELPGKIFLDKKDNGVYVRYLLGRTYDRDRQFNVPEYKVIGVQLEHMPGLMLPNDNYEAYFDSRGIELSEQARDQEESFAGPAPTEEEETYLRKREIFKTYVPYFNDLFYEIRGQSKRSQHEKISDYLITSLNAVLAKMLEMLEGEKGTEMLQLIEKEMKYNEVMVLLTQFKSAISEYRYEKM